MCFMGVLLVLKRVYSLVHDSFINTAQSSLILIDYFALMLCSGSFFNEHNQDMVTWEITLIVP